MVLHQIHLSVNSIDVNQLNWGESAIDYRSKFGVVICFECMKHKWEKPILRKVLI